MTTYLNPVALHALHQPQCRHAHLVCAVAKLKAMGEADNIEHGINHRQLDAQFAAQFQIHASQYKHVGLQGRERVSVCMCMGLCVYVCLYVCE